MDTRRMRFALLAVLFLLASPALAQQAGSVTFAMPTTGGTIAEVRLYRDSTTVGPVTSGQTIPNLFPANTGTWQFAFESRNAACGTAPLPTCPRVTRTVTLGPPPLQPPAAVINIAITAPCATAVPPTCTITVTSP